MLCQCCWGGAGLEGMDGGGMSCPWLVLGKPWASLTVSVKGEPRDIFRELILRFLQ